MSTEILEHALQFAINDQEQSRIIWHGGEPLLAGIDFYQHAFELQKQLNTNGISVDNLMQTNGTLLDRVTASFLHAHHVKIGLSYDGIHNGLLRGQTELVERNISLLKELGIPFGVLCVLSAKSIPDWRNVYESLKELEVPFKFDYVLNVGAATKNSDVLIDQNVLVFYLKELFNYWFHDRESSIHVRSLEKYLSLLEGRRGTECTYGSCMYHWSNSEPLTRQGFPKKSVLSTKNRCT